MVSSIVVEGRGFSPAQAGTEVPALLDPAFHVTCDPEYLNRDSYRLATDAQALNVTRPRTDWWDGFDATLRTHPRRPRQSQRGRTHHRGACDRARIRATNWPTRNWRASW